MNAIERNTDRLVSDLKRIVRDSEELLKATTGVVGDKTQQVRERLSETLKTAKDTCWDLEETADRTIRDHPYESIGIALGVGLLVGLLIGRK